MLAGQEKQSLFTVGSINREKYLGRLINNENNCSPSWNGKTEKGYDMGCILTANLQNQLGL